jgi:hypothetical protein
MPERPRVFSVRYNRLWSCQLVFLWFFLSSYIVCAPVGCALSGAMGASMACPPCPEKMGRAWRLFFDDLLPRTFNSPWPNVGISVLV